MSEKAYLALYLDAPLQSWGYASKFDRRTTLAYPTRSGVIGLLCAACGVDRSDVEGLARLEDALGVRVYVLRSGSRLTDYHTVGGGYDPQKEPLRISRKASGKVGATVQTWREYLEDACFGVVVSGRAELIEELAAALQDPVWGIWLGRKSCIPAARIFEGIYATEKEACDILLQKGGLESADGLRRVDEVVAFADGNDSVMDRPLHFAKRQFGARRICVEE